MSAMWISRLSQPVTAFNLMLFFLLFPFSCLISSLFFISSRFLMFSFLVSVLLSFFSLQFYLISFLCFNCFLLLHFLFRSSFLKSFLSFPLAFISTESDFFYYITIHFSHDVFWSPTPHFFTLLKQIFTVTAQNGNHYSITKTISGILEQGETLWRLYLVLWVTRLHCKVH